MSSPSPDFETSLSRLEQIVKQLDQGQITLEKSLEVYEEGIRLLRRCNSLLDAAQRRIEILRGIDENGNPVLETLREEQMQTLPEVKK